MSIWAHSNCEPELLSVPAATVSFIHFINYYVLLSASNNGNEINEKLLCPLRDAYVQVLSKALKVCNSPSAKSCLAKQKNCSQY
jgi:hypothetical protein